MTSSILIASRLRRIYHRAPLSLYRSFSFDNNISPPPPPTSFRFFSSHSSPPDSEFNNSVFNHDMNSVTESELRKLGFIDGSEIAGPAIDIEDSVFPIRAIVSLLDGYHDLTSLPWWIVIASSTVALRIVLLPLIIVQLQKLKQIGELFPKLPPPFPPPLSGKSLVAQFSLFRRERKALGCPSFLWLAASHTVQIPCFILWVASIRKMSLAEFPGFDIGGVLWFQDLTAQSSGVLGSVLPFLVAGLHFCNIQISFRGSSIDKQTGLLQLLAKLYRKYLEVLTLPLLVGAFFVPQGSLIYWVTNSSLTLVQQISLQNPTIRQKLGLVNKEALPAFGESEKDVNVAVDAPGRKGTVSAFDLSPLELVDLSVSYLSTNKAGKAVRLLRLAVEKDPDCFRAWTILGDMMVEKELFYEASEYAESAISKIHLLGEPYNAEAIDFLIQASIIAGGALYRQGKVAEALVHYERLKNIEEPDDPAAKFRYYEGLVIFASILLSEGRKDEAVRYLHLAADYNPRYFVLLKSVTATNDADDFVGDLTSTRRADY